MRSEPRNILKIFLNFTDFEPHYSYKIYSYKKKSVFECGSFGFKLFGFLRAKGYIPFFRVIAI